MHLTIPDKLMNSDMVIPVELEINGVKYYYPIVPAKPYISGAHISNGNKASVKINPRLICDTQNMATIVVPESYEGDVESKSIVPFHKPESDTDKDHDNKVYALKLRENEKGDTKPPLTIVIYETKEGEWVRLDSEGAKLSPNNYIAAELTKKDYDKGEVELTANNGDKITVPVKGDPPPEDEPPAIITVTRPPEKEDTPWTITDVVIGITLGGLAIVLGKFLFGGELAEDFIYNPAKGAYEKLAAKFGKEKEGPMAELTNERKMEIEGPQHKSRQKAPEIGRDEPEPKPKPGETGDPAKMLEDGGGSRISPAEEPGADDGLGGLDPAKWGEPPGAQSSLESGRDPAKVIARQEAERDRLSASHKAEWQKALDRNVQEKTDTINEVMRPGVSRNTPPPRSRSRSRARSASESSADGGWRMDGSEPRVRSASEGGATEGKLFKSLTANEAADEELGSGAASLAGRSLGNKEVLEALSKLGRLGA